MGTLIVVSHLCVAHSISYDIMFSPDVSQHHRTATSLFFI